MIEHALECAAEDFTKCAAFLKIVDDVSAMPQARSSS